MPNQVFGLTGAGVGAGAIWSNPGATTTIQAGNLPGQALPPIFGFDYSIENVTTEMIGNNAVRGVISFPKKGRVKLTTDYRVFPEVLAIMQGSAITATGTTPNRTWVLQTTAGVVRPIFAFDIYAVDLFLSTADIHWGAYNCIMTKDINMKGEAFKPDTKLDFEFDVFPDSANHFVIMAAHETAVAPDPTGQPKLP